LQMELKTAHARGVLFVESEVTAVFDSPSRAIQCALKLRGLLKDSVVRISLHVGECQVRDGRPSPHIVEAARRAAEVAPPDKIIVTQTLRDILAGSGFIFDLRQIHLETQKADSPAFYALT